MSPPTIDLPDRDQLLDEILASYLLAIKSGRAPSRQELLDSHPELADDLADFFTDQDKFDSLAAPLRAIVPASPSAREGQTLGNYEVLEEIARGGMGVVYRARQTNAARVVALKMLRAGVGASKDDLARFRTEVEAVARLDHISIVPVYEVGEHEGQPYFSMRLLEGGSLAQLLVSGKWSAAGKEMPRRAAGLVAVIARAVHHAHQRGILHRDLKPANILLDDEGQPHVSDFGLAKRVGGDSMNTLSGTVVGTPSYMAPEQASARKDGVTTAADVYSLGAILYEMLTGRPPFKGATPLETLHLAIETPPQRPRALRPELPRDLEAVCLKCLEKDPHNRYASALVLAEDLERFLAGESTVARPVGPAGQLWRWCRRKPLVASLAAGLILSLIVGLGLATWQWQEAEANFAESEKHREQAETNFVAAQKNLKLAEWNFARSEEHRQKAEQHQRLAEANFAKSEENRKRAEDNLHEAEQQRTLADHRFRQAHGAVNDFFTNVDTSLVHAPGQQELRRKLLQTGLDYYREFVKVRGKDPALRAELAEVYLRLGWLTAETGSKKEGVAALQQGLELYQELLRDDPKSKELQRHVASGHHNIALHQLDLGHSALALTNYEQARALYEQILHNDPTDSDSRALLASTVNNLAGLHRRAGLSGEAVKLYRLALELREKNLLDHPSNPNFQASVSHGLHNLGVVAETTGQPEQALDYFQKSLAIREKLTRAQPWVLMGQNDLASSYHSITMILRRLGRKAEALRAEEKGLEIREKLARENPKVIGYQMALAASHITRGHALGADQKYVEALAAHEQANAILRKAAKADPTSGALQRDVAKSFFNMGVETAMLKRRGKAMDLYRQAQAIQEQLVKADANNLEYRGDLSGTLNNLAILLSQDNRHEEARSIILESVAQQRFACVRAPKSDWYRRGMTTRLAALWSVEHRAGRWAPAAAAVRERKKLWPGNNYELSWASQNLAATAAAAEKAGADPEEVGRYAAEALTALREAFVAGFRDFERLQTNADFALLRQRDEFRKLLEEFQK